MPIENDIPYTPKNPPDERVITVEDCKYYTYTWKATGEYRGRVLFVHGYRDTSVGYYETCERLAAAGYETFYFDQRGEGLSVLVTGEKGTASDKTALAAVDYFIEFNLKELEEQGKPHDKLYVISVSMGGGIMLNYSILGNHKDKIAALVNIAPLVRLHEKTYPGRVTEFAVRTLCAFPFFQKLHVKTELHADYVAGDPVYADYIRRRYAKEPLTATLVESRDFILRGRRLLKPEYYTKVDKKMPILICHGDTDYVNWVEGSKQFIDKVNSVSGMENKSIILYPGGRHVLLIDKPEIKEKVFADTIGFFNRY